MSIAKWAEGPFIAFDVESTAADPLEARIIQYCLSYISKNEAGKFKLDTVMDYVNPGVEIPQGAIDVHGITNERIAELGKDPSDSIASIIAALAGACNLNASIVIMNAAYDLTVLDREARRHNLATLSDSVDSFTVIDPMVLDKRFVKYRKRVSDDQGARCLKTIAQVYGLPWDDDKAHDAEYDTLQTARVVIKMGKYVMADPVSLMKRGWRKDDVLQMSQTRYLSTKQLHESQIVWCAEQSEDLKQYFLKVGNQEAADSVHGQWPMITYKEASF